MGRVGCTWMRVLAGRHTGEMSYTGGTYAHFLAGKQKYFAASSVTVGADASFLAGRQRGTGATSGRGGKAHFLAAAAGTAQI